MEGPDVSAAEPQKVRNPKPRKQNSTVRAQQGVQGQQPSIRKSNRARGAPPLQQQPEAANWGYHQGDGYENVDPAHYYPEGYGYGTGEHYGHGTGEHYGHGTGEHYGYGTGEHYGSGTGEHYGSGSGEHYGSGTGEHYGSGTGEHYGSGTGEHYGSGTGEHYGSGTGEHYGSGTGEQYGHGYDYGFDPEYGYTYGDAEANAGADYGYAAPTQPVKGKARKSRKPKPVAADGEPHGAGYENQGDTSGQSVQGGYADGYAYSEVHNAVAPEQQPSTNPPKRESKHRKPSRTKSIESGNPGDDESSVASRALSAEPDVAGSARSSGSSRSKPDRSDRSVNGDGSRHSRASNRLEEEGSTPRGGARDQRDEGSGRSNPERRKPKVEGEGSAKPMKLSNPEANALNEHIRKTGGGKPALEQEGSTTRSTTDHREDGSGRSNPERRKQKLENEVEGSTKSTKSSNPEVNALNEHLRKTGGGKPVQDSLVVFDDREKGELETRMFGAPLATKPQSLKLPPVDEKSWNPPQFRQPQQRPVADQPLYQPSRHRRAHVEPDLYGREVRHGQALEVQPLDVGATRTVNKSQALQKKPEPNAKCMACVHGVGVPIARLATRIACNQCMCTIL